MIERIFSEYKECGLLVRTDDGNYPRTSEQINDEISGLTLTSNLSGLINTGVPPYSASLISSKTPPVIWYNNTFSEVFPNRSGNPGERTLVATMFKNNKIDIYGGTPWDGDTNLRLLGNIPPTKTFNRSAPFNIVSQLESEINGNNNNPYYNPMFYPLTNNNRTNNYKQVCDYLNLIGGYKGSWVNAIKKDSNGYTKFFANYIDKNYTTGIEPEILITSSSNQEPFFYNKFNQNDLVGIAFITDAFSFPNIPDAAYKLKANTFIQNISGKQGWCTSIDNTIPLFVIKRVALPNVPVQGTDVSSGSIGTEWITYLNKFQYTELEKDDFKMIK